MSIFEKGEKMLAAAFNFAAVNVSYCRNGIPLAINIPAKLGKTLFATENDYGVAIRLEGRDFIVRSSDLPVVPRVGDEILYSGSVFRVSAPDGEPCWKWHNRLGLSEKRIHTKFVEVLSE